MFLPPKITQGSPMMFGGSASIRGGLAMGNHNFGVGHPVHTFVRLLATCIGQRPPSKLKKFSKHEFWQIFTKNCKFLSILRLKTSTFKKFLACGGFFAF
jgi:hypothetical protein